MEPHHLAGGEDPSVIEIADGGLPIRLPLPKGLNCPDCSGYIDPQGSDVVVWGSESQTVDGIAPASDRYSFQEPRHAVCATARRESVFGELISRAWFLFDSVFSGASHTAFG